MTESAPFVCLLDYVAVFCHRPDIFDASGSATLDPTGKPYYWVATTWSDSVDIVKRCGIVGDAMRLLDANMPDSRHNAGNDYGRHVTVLNMTAGVDFGALRQHSDEAQETALKAAICKRHRRHVVARHDIAGMSPAAVVSAVNAAIMRSEGMAP